MALTFSRHSSGVYLAIGSREWQLVQRRARSLRPDFSSSAGTPPAPRDKASVTGGAVVSMDPQPHKASAKRRMRRLRDTDFV